MSDWLPLNLWDLEFSQEAKDMADSVLLGSTDFNQSLNDAVKCDDSLEDNHHLGQYFVGIQDVYNNPIILDNDISVAKEEVVITCVEGKPAEPVVEVPFEPQPGPSSEVKGLKRKRGRPADDPAIKVEKKRERERLASQRYRDKKKTEEQVMTDDLEAQNNRKEELEIELMAAEGLYSSIKQLYANNWNIFKPKAKRRARKSLRKIKKQLE